MSMINIKIIKKMAFYSAAGGFYKKIGDFDKKIDCEFNYMGYLELATHYKCSEKYEDAISIYELAIKEINEIIEIINNMWFPDNDKKIINENRIINLKKNIADCLYLKCDYHSAYCKYCEINDNNNANKCKDILMNFKNDSCDKIV